MADARSVDRKRRMFERYPMLFALGLVIIVISLALMGWRQLNEQVRIEEIAAGRGPPTPSAAYVAADRLEQALHHIIEQLIFVGLAALKLGIGFSIAVIVLNLQETGMRSLEAFQKTGVLPTRRPLPQPWSAKFPKFLIAGFLVVLFFFLLSFLWVYYEYIPFGDRVTTRMVLEAIIKPGKMIGTAVLLLGIGAGLATIIVNLRMQAQALPALVVAAGRRTKAIPADLMAPGRPVPRKLFVPLLLGFAVVVTAYVPVAAFLAWNRATNLTSGRWSSASAQSLEVILEHWIESYILAGIALLLFGIGFLLITIVRSLRWQRERLMGALADLSGSKPSAGRPPVRAVKIVPGFLVGGLAIVVLSLVLTVVWIGAALEAVATGAPSAILADHVWEAFVKPFKFAGLALIFLGIGLVLGVIVVNLQMIAMALPGLFARFADAVRGRAVKPLDLPEVDPMKLFPKKLFEGILAGFAIVVTATFPLGWPLRTGTFAAFLPALLGSGLATDAAAVAAFAFERFLEHLILPYKLAGLAVIFYAIGRFFATIIGFVRARKTIVSEGIGAITANLEVPVAAPDLGSPTDVTREPAVA